MNEFTVMSMVDATSNELILWMERSLSGHHIYNPQLSDLVDKAKQAGVDIPVGKENAISKSVLIERIVSNLTYSL